MNVYEDIMTYISGSSDQLFFLPMKLIDKQKEGVNEQIIVMIKT
jgi:hypothetical protein